MSPTTLTTHQNVINATTKRGRFSAQASIAQSQYGSSYVKDMAPGLLISKTSFNSPQCQSSLKKITKKLMTVYTVTAHHAFLNPLDDLNTVQYKARKLALT